MAAKAKKVAKVETVVNAIPQNEVEIVYAQQAVVVELKAKLKAAEKALDAVESGLIAKLNAGTPVEQGAFIAMLQKSPGRIAVPWKGEAIKAIVANEGCTELQAEANVKARYPAGVVTTLAISKLGV